MHRIHYIAIFVLAILVGIAAEVFIIRIHGANPFADMSRLIVGSIVWIILIMIALLLIVFMYERMANRYDGFTSASLIWEVAWLTTASQLA